MNQQGSGLVPDAALPGLTLPGLPLSNAEVDRLGDRLRSDTAISESDLMLLQNLRSEYDAALLEAQRIVRGAVTGVEVSSRIKTVHTIVDKLRRESSMKLSRMQDIAGLRLVGDLTLDQQDQMSARVVELLEGGRIVDRRADPSHGYRAVHVYAKVRERRIEVQIRTRLQDRWAQIVERLADRWGRQIRYGGTPAEPSKEDTALVPRGRVCDLVTRMTEPIAMCETGKRTPVAGSKAPPIAADSYCQEVDNVLRQLASKALSVADL